MCSTRCETDRTSSTRLGVRGRIGIRALLAAFALVATAVALAGPAPAWGRVPKPPTSPTPPPPCLPTATTCGSTNPLTTAPQTGTSGYPTPLPGYKPRSNGLPGLNVGDPFCADGMSAQQAANCRASGSVAEAYPLSSYEIDYENPPTGLSQLSVNDWFGTVMGAIASAFWDVWLYIVRGVLDLLDWAFSLDLVDAAMNSVTHGLDVMHNDIFGSSWMLAALSIVGLWGIWNGLVKRKTIETLAGLAITVVMMIGALVLIAHPDQTVGQFSRVMNNASLAALNAGTRGSVDIQHPQHGFAATEGDLFNAVVLDPWCALQFNDVNYCTEARPGGMTVADMWLSFPAMGQGRQALFNVATTGTFTPNGGFWGAVQKVLGSILSLGTAPSSPATETPAQACGADPHGQQCKALKAAQALTCWSNNAVASPACAFTPSQQNEAAMQAGGSPLSRLALLGMISIGLLGAVLVLLYLGIKLLFAAIKVLLLTLAAPVMLFVPAFGEAGRATFAAYGKRLVGALISKLVFAVMLALVLLIGGIIWSLPFDWFSVWMLSIVFWWGIFFERKQFIGFLSMDKKATEGGLDVSGHGSPFRLVGAMLALNQGAALAGRVGRGVTALPRFARHRHLDRARAQSGAYRELADEDLDARARRAVGMENRERVQDARDTVTGQDMRRTRLGEMRGQRKALQDQLDAERAKPGGTKNRKAKSLESKRDALDRRIDVQQRDIAEIEPDVAIARSTLGRLGDGDSVDGRDARRWRDQRQLDLVDPMPRLDGAPPADVAQRAVADRALRAAGVDPAAHWSQPDQAVRRQNVRAAEEAWMADRAHFDRVDGEAHLRRYERRAARAEVRERGEPTARRVRLRTEQNRHEIRHPGWHRNRPRGG